MCFLCSTFHLRLHSHGQSHMEQRCSSKVHWLIPLYRPRWGFFAQFRCNEHRAENQAIISLIPAIWSLGSETLSQSVFFLALDKYEQVVIKVVCLHCSPILKENNTLKCNILKKIEVTHLWSKPTGGSWALDVISPLQSDACSEVQSHLLRTMKLRYLQIERPFSQLLPRMSLRLQSESSSLLISNSRFSMPTSKTLSTWSTEKAVSRKDLRSYCLSVMPSGCSYSITCVGRLPFLYCCVTECAL